ncbi:MAG: hypothetical protein NZ742_11070 [Acidobacteria bacterium]|nr:hypothetical protein [Acidobacteriota bacterium]MDW7985241.1 hypothetical protein [Acidobacteriota bacterium]
MTVQDETLEHALTTLRAVVDRTRRRLAIERMGTDGRRAMQLLRCPLDGLVAGVLYAMGGRMAVRRLYRSGRLPVVPFRYESRGVLLELLKGASTWTEIRTQALACLRRLENAAESQP